MLTVTIDEQFKRLLPPLSEETFNLLEENILQNGCRDSLVLWNGILIDGYNRYEICTKHDLPFNTVDKEFDSREEVTIWIILNQVSRRNLTPIQLSNYRGLHYRADKVIVTNSEGKNQHLQAVEVVRQNDGQPQSRSTSARLSEQHNVSPRTIERDAKISEALEAISEFSPEAADLILTGKVKIDKKVLEKLLICPKEEIEALAMAIENGTYEKEKPALTTQPQGNDGSGSGVGSSSGISAGLGSGTGSGSAQGFTPDSDLAPGSDPAPSLPTASVVNKTINSFYDQIIALTKDGATTATKKAFRTFIDKLEKLYDQM